MIVIKKFSLKFNEIIQEHLFVILFQGIFESCYYQDQINEQASEFNGNFPAKAIKIVKIGIQGS